MEETFALISILSKFQCEAIYVLGYIHICWNLFILQKLRESGNNLLFVHFFPPWNVSMYAFMLSFRFCFALMCSYFVLPIFLLFLLDMRKNTKSNKIAKLLHSLWCIRDGMNCETASSNFKWKRFSVSVWFFLRLADKWKCHFIERKEGNQFEICSFFEIYLTAYTIHVLSPPTGAINKFMLINSNEMVEIFETEVFSFPLPLCVRFFFIQQKQKWCASSTNIAAHNAFRNYYRIMLTQQELQRELLLFSKFIRENRIK